MPHPIDASVKYLITERLADWLPLSGRRAEGPVEVIDADLSTVTAYADKVLRVGSDPWWLLHLELQAYWDPLLASRVHFYNALLEHRHGAPVWSVVVLLRKSADHISLTGKFERGFPGEDPYRTFRYQVVRVWEMPVEAVLTGELGALPLAPLSNVTEGDLPGVIQRMETRIRSEATREEQGPLWTATGILMGMRYAPGLIANLLQGVSGMEESTFYQHIMEKGAVKEAQKFVLRLGRAQLGAPSQQIETAVAAIADIDRLERLGERLRLVSSWDELLAAP